MDILISVLFKILPSHESQCDKCNDNPQFSLSLHDISKIIICNMRASAETVSVCCTNKQIIACSPCEVIRRMSFDLTVWIPVCVWHDWYTLYSSVTKQLESSSQIAQSSLCSLFWKVCSTSIQLGKDTNIHVVLLDLMFPLASTESTCYAYCSISKALGMQEGQTFSWHPLTVYTCIFLWKKRESSAIESSLTCLSFIAVRSWLCSKSPAVVLPLQYLMKMPLYCRELMLI